VAVVFPASNRSFSLGWFVNGHFDVVFLSQLFHYVPIFTAGSALINSIPIFFGNAKIGSHSSVLAVHTPEEMNLTPFDAPELSAFPDLSY
jgi:hypothetical protein